MTPKKIRNYIVDKKNEGLDLRKLPEVYNLIELVFKKKDIRLHRRKQKKINVKRLFIKQRRQKKLTYYIVIKNEETLWLIQLRKLCL